MAMSARNPVSNPQATRSHKAEAVALGKIAAWVFLIGLVVAVGFYFWKVVGG